MKFKNVDIRKYLVDLLMVTSCYVFIAGVYLVLMEGLRFDELKVYTFPIFLGYFFLYFTIFGQYKNIWKYFSLRNLVHGTFAMLATAFSFVVTLVVIFYPGPYWAQYVASGIMLSLLSYAVVMSSRMIWRWLFLKRSNKEYGNARRIAIVGGGSACTMLLDYIRMSNMVQYKPVCIFDDDVAKYKQKIDDVKIVASIDKIPEVCKELNIDEIIIAMPSVKGERMKEIINICLETHLIVNTMPLLDEIRKDKTSDLWKEVRRIKPEDLLGRNSIELDKTSVSSYVKDKVVLVSGGGGSIGSELCRQVAKLSPKKLVIMDIYENSTYEIQQELLRKYGTDIDLSVEIATMCDVKEVDDVFNRYRPDIVYHAAAHKHVPLMEHNPEEAVKNNVFGTHNMIVASDKYGIKKFIQISTDKAVNPTNVMGATKRFCEMMVQSMRGKSNTEYVAVRFGNVLGSNGSVIPLFKKQIENGGPVTVTHPDMKRYFMTIPEAVQLVMLAGAEAESGNVYVLDMGSLVNISDFARKMIILAGLVPDKDIKIEYSGLRPGEKLYEELIMDDDRVDKTKLDKVFIEKLPKITKKEVDEGLKLFKEAISTGDKRAVAHALEKVVTTYTPDENMRKEIDEYLSLQNM